MIISMGSIYKRDCKEKRTFIVRILCFQLVCVEVMAAFCVFAQMIHNYMEHLERTKHQHAVAAPEPADTGTNTTVRIR